MKTVKALILLMAMLLSVACSNDDNAAIGVSDDTIIEPPVNDAMSVTTDIANSHYLYPIGPNTTGVLYQPLVYNNDLTWETTLISTCPTRRYTKPWPMVQS